ncbi:DUF6880 family protein [Nocardia brevicatena]|uniref:DUF6880 family protein n=1 Tax=Nocardia brevicatena TaxID=37327 RepID=UPI0015771C49|nr:DUF6880 family protein [Nocardia brevicatena]
MAAVAAQGTIVAVSALADAVLPLIRTRTDLHRWSAANEHGRQMHEALDLLDAAAAAGDDPREVFAVTQKAIASAVKVIARADDSSGIIGDACRRLLRLHPVAATAAKPPAARLVAWMLKFQFEGEVDFFELDPVAYAPALGDKGLTAYRAKLAEIDAGLGPELPAPQPPAGQPYRSDQAAWDRWGEDQHTRFTLEWNARRLAVLDRDVEAIIATHSRDRAVAAWFTDTAEALAEIGQIDLALDWAKQGADFDHGHQAHQAAEYWCTLLAEHRPGEELSARWEVFTRWPASGTAARLHRSAGESWPDYHDATLERLSPTPRHAVLFALQSLRDTELAWQLAHSLNLQDADTWSLLVTAYEKIDPLAVLPALTDLVLAELTEAGARHYQIAARRLKKMRTLADGTDKQDEVDRFILELRETHRRRPRLQREFDRAGLPA